MPDPGTDDAEARIVGWCVSAGDEVAEGDPICVVSVDGHRAEVLSASAGRVAELLVGVDAPVAAGAMLVTFEALSDQNDTSIPEREPELEPRPKREPREMAGFHSPAVRRLAAEHSVDLTQVPGTGKGGRIRREDVLAALGDA